MRNQITAFVFLFCLILFSSISNAQITYTSDDYAAIHAIGHEITNYSDTTVTSVNIGSPGGGNNWNFSNLKALNMYKSTNVTPSSTPYFSSDFPTSNLVSQLTLLPSDEWVYETQSPDSVLINGIVTHGTVGSDTYLNIAKYSPGYLYLSFPFTFNSQWNSDVPLETTIYKNGALSSSKTYEYIDSVNVDAYGSVIMPGGDTLPALRIRTVITILGDSINNTTVNYTFLSPGYSVDISFTDNPAPNSGVVQTNVVDWAVTNYTPTILVTKPVAGEVVLAGSDYNITWKTSGSKSLHIDFSADSGRTYTTIANNVPAGANSFTWKAKDTLDAKCEIRIVDVDDTTKKAFSGLFHIKGYVLTRIDNSGNYEKFDPRIHGWSYPNYHDPMWPTTWWSEFNYTTGIDPNTNRPYPAFFSRFQSSTFPDWPLFVQAFTPAQCYIGTKGGYRKKAQLEWKDISDPTFKGSCFGFVISSFLAFEYKTQFLAANPGMTDFTDLYSLSISNEIRKIINENSVLQYGKQTQGYRIPNERNQPSTTLQQLKNMLISDNPNIQTVFIYYYGKGGGGHCLAPYKLVSYNSLFSGSTYKLFVYDSNHPGDTTCSINIDSSKNIWSYDMGSGHYWSGSDNFYLDIPVVSLLATPIILNKKNDLKLQKSKSVDYIGLYNTPGANVMYTSSDGKHIGITDSVATNEIANATPIFKETGYPSNPIGYYVPDDSYTAVMNNATDSTGKVYMTAFKNDVIYDYERDSANVTQTDRFRIDSGFSVVSPDPGKKHITNLEVIAESDTLERIMFLDNTQLSQNDSLFVQEVNQQNFVIKNYGAEKTYDLELDNRATTGQKVFQYPSIDLKANSTHILVPDWNNLNTSSLKIYVDPGNKGKITDSLSLANQVTGINNNPPLTVPEGYNLAQNYPNPFNPTTMINYTVPKGDLVTIKVYDILGREVATLVNEVKGPGNYSVEFNASKLSSGVYFYRLQAGSFVETKKMILMK